MKNVSIRQSALSFSMGWREVFLTGMEAQPRDPLSVWGGGGGCLQTSSKLTPQRAQLTAPEAADLCIANFPKSTRKIGRGCLNQLNWFYREAPGLLRLPYVKKKKAKKVAYSQSLNTPLFFRPHRPQPNCPLGSSSHQYQCPFHPFSYQIL